MRKKGIYMTRNSTTRRRILALLEKKKLESEIGKKSLACQRNSFLPFGGGSQGGGRSWGPQRGNREKFSWGVK